MTDHHPTLELVEHDGRPTLELVRHDETARAPERDYDATGFELDASCIAPEVLPVTAPQVLYRNSLPEVNGNMEESSEVPVVRDAPKSTLKWLWLLVALVLIAAIAIGVGVGIWHTRRKGSSGISQPVAGPRTPINASTAQYILNDTSLAAAILPNNDRHLYFQDSTGRIRYVIRTAITDQWSLSPADQWNLSPDSNITASAKNHTPLAVTAFKPNGSVKIEVFYVSQNYHLSSCFTLGSLGAWQNDGSLSNYTTAPNTRSLSVTSNLQAIQAINNATNPLSNMNVTTTMAVLFYESPNGILAVLSRVANGCSTHLCPYSTASDNPIYTGDLRNFSWIDNSSALQKACDTVLDPSTCQYGPPFASSQYAESTNFSVILKYPLWQNRIVPPAYYLLKTVSYTPLKNSDDSDVEVLPSNYHLNGPFSDSLQQSDMAMILNADFGYDQGVIWINKSQPITEDTVLEMPTNTFPFARLASVSTLDNQTTYLYHQMNGTTFAEEVYYASVQKWGEPTYINVTPPP